MANQITRYEAKTAEEFAKWLGHINPLTLHKLYVKKTKGKWHCMAILHDVGSAPAESITKEIKSNGGD